MKHYTHILSPISTVNNRNGESTFCSIFDRMGTKDTGGTSFNKEDG